MAGKKAAFIARADGDTREQFAMLKSHLHLQNSALFSLALYALARREGVPIDDPEPIGGPSTRLPQIRRITDPQTPIASKRTR